VEITLKQIPMEDLSALAYGSAPCSGTRIALPGSLPPAFVAQRALAHLAAGKPAAWCSTFYVQDASGRIIGGCGFKDVPCNGEVELGYAITPEARGQGAGRAAVQQLLGFAAQSLEVRVVVANVNPDNLPSIRLVQPLGFMPARECPAP